jgi:hypothetical protein
MTITFKTSLRGNFRILVLEEHFDSKTGEPYLVDEAGLAWIPDPADPTAV